MMWLREEGKTCSEGCECSNYSNVQDILHRDNTDDLLEVSIKEIIANKSQTEANDIMELGIWQQ